MAQVALLIGVKSGKRELIDQGDPREIRRKFKLSQDGEGFDEWEVFESTVGRSRRKRFVKDAPMVELDTKPEPEPVETPDLDSEEDHDEDPAHEVEGDAPKRRGRPPKHY